ncbi:MAG: hypothetical protein H6841_09510 [Planctomycetes bacterium]|nr:hypothetical protein [Planctomycetota bacterium]MCB9936156.1 hypothetical protein [Planctomycetota bacterium]
MTNQLTPYGHSGPVDVNQGIWSHDYLAAAFERAKFKVANVVAEAPVGPDSIYRVYGWLNLGIGLAWLALALVASTATGNVVGLSCWPIILIAASSHWFNWHKNTNPDRPERAVQAWIGALMRKKWERVDRLRLHGDRDSFPRRMAGGAGAVEMPMSNVFELEQYWKELRRSAGLNGGRWTFKKPNVRPLGRQLAVVEAEISVGRFPQIYALAPLLLFIATLVALFVFVLDKKGSTPDWIGVFPLVLVVCLVAILVIVGWRRKLNIKKVVVYNGMEWRLLSGEWQAPEDRDLRWMN